MVAQLLEDYLMAQNKSHAVMGQRTEKRASLDDFPTPPWAVRALLMHVLVPMVDCQPKHMVSEPACGRGDMSDALREYFGSTQATDIKDYGYAGMQRKADYRDMDTPFPIVDWTITNPPFNAAEAFITRALMVSRKGVAIFIRSTFTESVGRYNRIFRDHPPNIVAQFSERVVLHKSKLSEKGSTATAYCWLVWETEPRVRRFSWHTKYVWIPPCRAELEKSSDYDRYRRKRLTRRKSR